MTEDDPYADLKQHRWTPEMEAAYGRAVVPEKIRRRRRHFIKLPMTWYERLNGAGGQTYQLAWWLLYMHWKDRSQPIKLANGMLGYDGVSRKSKWRALNDLESRGLIVVERRPRRSPIVRLVPENLQHP